MDSCLTLKRLRLDSSNRIHFTAWLSKILIPEGHSLKNEKDSSDVVKQIHLINDDETHNHLVFNAAVLFKYIPSVRAVKSVDTGFTLQWK